MKAMRIPLRIVFYRSEGVWIAHCLEFDLCGDGPTQEAAIAQLSDSIQIQVAQSLKHDNPRNLFSPADGEVFQKFAEGKDVAMGELHLEIKPVSMEAQYREYEEGPADVSNRDLVKA
jgi:hypothetical protein